MGDNRKFMIAGLSGIIVIPVLAVLAVIACVFLLSIQIAMAPMFLTAIFVGSLRNWIVGRAKAVSAEFTRNVMRVAIQRAMRGSLPAAR